MRCRLEIQRYKAWVRLGAIDAERAVPQEVEFNVRLDFQREPPAVFSDELRDAIDYDRLCGLIEEVSRRKEYRLVEALAREVFEALRAEAGQATRLWIEVHKLHPPIRNLAGGVRFSYGDGEPQ